MLLQRRIERYTGASDATASEEVPEVEMPMAQAPVLDELDFDDLGFHELVLEKHAPKEDAIAVVISDDAVLEEPLSPELVLVLPPELGRLARELLPEPEPLDEWLARMRRQDLEREWQRFVATVQVREHESAPGSIGGFVFAGVMVIVSVAPALASLIL